MSIQFYPDELDYVNAKLGSVQNVNDEAPKCGGFLQAFLIACLRADDPNYEIIQPALRTFMQIYPADPERLEMERHDNGRTKS